jgi:hypothetical protein
LQLVVGALQIGTVSNVCFGMRFVIQMKAGLQLAIGRRT